MFKDKKIAIWGKGKEGESLLKYCINNEMQYTVFEGENIDLTGFDVLFKSPGVSLYNDSLKKSLSDGIELWSGTNIFMSQKNPSMKTIAITGTKGKSTTSSLLAHILKKKGFNVGFGGNIGKPLVDFVGQTFDFFVAELSSYQSADLKYPFDVSVITNLYPEHIDWHKTHSRYYEDKLNLIRIRKAGQKAILNKKNTETLNRTKNEKDVIYFNDESHIHLSDGYIMDGDNALLNTSHITNLKGVHNLENICAVLTVLKELKIDLKNIEQEIASFEALPHRLQTVASVGGVMYVDDSISTTPETSLAALKAFSDANHIYLLVGGYDRKQDYSVLLDYVRKNAEKITLIALPLTGSRIVQQAIGLKCIEVESVSEAVLKTKTLSKSGDVVLLSPGAPSYHAYKNFEERGNDFKNAITV
ncbi:MAG: UDP-N-acetylmuramoyl-L-alanine--D-glutamate ligase [Alphaproteobacteria bacterium]|nr:UDP-N-acetylmuramoyl-L-alanine--D-glutamate ligase [Alphaproteobacteria bacterium]